MFYEAWIRFELLQTIYRTPAVIDLASHHNLEPRVHGFKAPQITLERQADFVPTDVP